MNGGGEWLRRNLGFRCSLVTADVTRHVSDGALDGQQRRQYMADSGDHTKEVAVMVRILGATTKCDARGFDARNVQIQDPQAIWPLCFPQSSHRKDDQPEGCNSWSVIEGAAAVRSRV